METKLNNFERKIFTYSQIEQQFNVLNSDEKVVALVSAMGIKEISPEKTKEVCIALAMGYKKCMSGSGFFEKV